MTRTFFFVVAALCLPAAPARAALPDLPEIVLEHVVTVGSPLYVTHAGDERLFIVQRIGRIRIYRPDTGLEPVSFLDASSRVQTGGDGGMFSSATSSSCAPLPRSATSGSPLTWKRTTAERNTPVGV